MARLLQFYSRSLQHHPVITHSVTAGSLYGSGDVLAQQLEKAYAVQSTGKSQYNCTRTARMFLFGFVAAGPILGAWYPLLHRMTSVFRYEYVAMKTSSAGLTSMRGMHRRFHLSDRVQRVREVVLKVVLDQFFFQAPFLNIYLFFMSMIECHSIEESVQSCKRNFHDSWRYSIIFWFPAQLLNFAVVPFHLNAVTVSVFSIFWTAFLSLLYHYRDYGPEARRDGDSMGMEVKLCTACASTTSPAPAEEHPPPQEVRHLQKQIEVQREQLEGQEVELDRLRRTVAAQADKIKAAEIELDWRSES